MATMTSKSYEHHAAILQNSPPGALGVYTNFNGVTHVLLPRIYYPSQTSALTDLSVANLVHRSAPFSRLYYSSITNPQTKVLDRRTIVAFCDGVYLPNGAKGVGVFFGLGSEHNVAEALPASERSTPQRAQLHAVHRALQVARANITAGDKVSTVVLATDSDYIIRTLSEDVFRWQLNGWTDEQGRKVENAQKVQEVDRLIEEMAVDGLDVEFWRVPREDNQEANGLAKARM